MTKTNPHAHHRTLHPASPAGRRLLLQWSLLVVLSLQGFFLNAQTDCEDLHIVLGESTQTCENARACFTITGGTPPYTVVAVGENGIPVTANPNYCFLQLQPFTDYVVTVADAAGCTASTELDLPGASNFDAEITHVTCHGGENGRIEPLIPIDVDPLFYHWEGPDGFTSDDEVVEGLGAGTYYLILRTTNNQCIGISHWEVTEPAAIQFQLSIDAEPCHLASACITVSGGTAPYTVRAFHILPAVLGGSTSGHLEDGDLDLNAGIHFNPTLAGSFCADGLSNGSYYFVIVDANGCYRWDDFGIQNTATFTRQREVRRVTCNGGDDGRICFGIAGGIEPFSTTLSPPGMNVGITTRQGCFEHLSAGVYTLATIDSTGCLLSEAVIVREPDVLTATFERTNSECDAGGADGCLTIQGGTGPNFQVSLWQFPAPGPSDDPAVTFSGNQPTVAGGTLMTIPFLPTNNVTNVRCAQNIPAGIYYILTVDANLCYTLTPLEVHISNDPIEAHFEINSTSPCAGASAGCLYVNGGTGPYELTVWRWNSPLTVIPEVHFDDQGNPFINGVQPTDDMNLFPAPNGSGVWCAQQIPPGFYLILVQDANGCYVLVHTNLTSSTGLQVTADVRNANCNGVVSRIKLTITGGTAPYTIYRNNSTPPAVTQTNMYVVEDLPPGTYTFVIYDNFQCSTTITVTIAQAGEIDLNLEFDPLGEEACVHPEGGTAPYVIRWYNLATNAIIGDGQCIHNLAPGAYRVAVHDAGGCETDAIFFIDEQPCAAGEASVEPDVIESGASTTFFLHNWSGQSVQWQFRTEQTGWLNIPGATSATYHTPPMHSAVDRVIHVRAVIQCNGTTLISEPAHFTILGNNLLPPASDALGAALFDATYQAQMAELMAEYAAGAMARVFPTVTQSESRVQFTRDITGSVRITLVSLMGEVMHQTALSNPKAGQMTEVSLAEVPQGAYLVRIESGAGVQTARIIVNR